MANVASFSGMSGLPGENQGGKWTIKMFILAAQIKIHKRGNNDHKREEKPCWEITSFGMTVGLADVYIMWPVQLTV